MLGILRNRTFRALFAAQAVALVGTGLSTVALALLAHDLAGGDAGVVLGTALAVKMVAYILVSPVVGGLAPRLPREGLLLGLNLARAGVVACLPFVENVWQIYGLIFLLSACAAGYTPSFQAMLPDVLPDEGDYTRALSLTRLAQELENLISPLLAAGALVFLAYDALFAANAGAFVVAAGLIAAARLPEAAAATETEATRRALTLGIRAYLRTPRLRSLLALSLAVAAAGAMVIVNTVVLVRTGFGGTETQTALAFAAAGTGSITAALALPRLLAAFPERAVMASGGTALGAGLLLGPLVGGFAALLPLWFLIGVGSSLVQTPAGRLLRRSSDASTARPSTPPSSPFRMPAGSLPIRWPGGSARRPACRSPSPSSG